ncbi:MAG: hypothetical protein FWE32_07995 [Oscillospiraceae bacterium]|nr:hypothetical protein [Oscillospiraceae bacterium]
MSDVILRVIPIAISLVALIVSAGTSFFTRKMKYQDAVKNYFQTGDSPEHKGYRCLIYELCENNDDTIEAFKTNERAKEAAAHIVSFYELWYLLHVKGYLPIWAFSGIPGQRAVRMYKLLTPYISWRLKDTKGYGVRFEKLVQRIQRKYGDGMDSLI